MSDKDADDPCQGERDLLAALEARLIELGVLSKEGKPVRWSDRKRDNLSAEATR